MVQTKSRISSPHPASAGELPAASWAKLCLLFSIVQSHSRKKRLSLFKTQRPSYTSIYSFSPPFFPGLCVFLSLIYLLLLCLCLSSPVLWSFFTVHMLLELNGGEWRERGDGQLNPPPEGASVSLFPHHHLSLSPSSSFSADWSEQCWPQTDGCITEEQHDIKQKECSQMTNQVRDVARVQCITNICR